MFSDFNQAAQKTKLSKQTCSLVVCVFMTAVGACVKRVAEKFPFCAGRRSVVMVWREEGRMGPEGRREKISV